MFSRTRAMRRDLSMGEDEDMRADCARTMVRDMEVDGAVIASEERELGPADHAAAKHGGGMKVLTRKEETKTGWKWREWNSEVRRSVV